ncbi:MAG: plasmid recombination protein [Muribaculaceae bacterium]|nr:plasmid recombination protein [Muribaculaceae bacterium]
MTRENLTRFQDTYAGAMEWFGLERGIRGSEARHVDQHEYYRQCQMRIKVLNRTWRNSPPRRKN